MALVGTKTISNVECEIHARESGLWTVKEAGDEGAVLGSSDESLEKALTHARQSLSRNRVKVSVPYLVPVRQGEKMKFRSGSATGIHQKTGNVLVSVNKKADQVSSYTKVLSVDMNPDERAEFLEALEAIAEWQEVETALRKKYEFSIGVAVREAIAKVSQIG